MKKNLLSVLAAVIVFTVAGCGGGNPCEADKIQPVDEAALISNCIDGHGTTDENPVPLGQWAKITVNSYVVSGNATVYMRVNKVTTDTEDYDYVQGIIANHDSFSAEKFSRAESDVPEDAELCVVEYEIYIPKGFPCDENKGAEDFKLLLDANKVGGGGIPAADGSGVYLGMGSSLELATSKNDIYLPGNSYPFAAVYAMVKGFDNYVLSDYDLVSENDEYVQYDYYFAHK